MPDQTQDVIYAVVALLCAGAGSVYDVKERRIPNLLTGPAILAGLLLHLTFGGAAQLGSSALAGLIGGGLFLVFFLARGMGGGDVKLMTAVGCIMGLPLLGTVMIATVLVGSALALALAFQRGRLRETLANVATLMGHHHQRGLEPHPVLNLANANTLRLPYALPIAAGCLITVLTLAWRG